MYLFLILIFLLLERELITKWFIMCDHGGSNYILFFYVCACTSKQDILLVFFLYISLLSIRLYSNIVRTHYMVTCLSNVIVKRWNEPRASNARATSFTRNHVATRSELSDNIVSINWSKFCVS